MEAFEELLSSIAARPGLYVTRGSISAVGDYLTGYCHALTDLGYKDPLYAWPMWIYQRFRIWHPAWHWTRVLLHVYGSDREALAALRPLYAQFAAQRDDLDVDAMRSELRRQLILEHGRDRHEPESTRTAPPPSARSRR